MEEENNELTASSFINRLKLPLGLAIAGITLVSAGIYFTLQKNDKKEIKFSNSEMQVNTASTSSDIVVHIAGEVLNPGVYRLPLDSRVNDLIQKAGGISTNADKNYIDKNLNLALPLKDGIKIYIPSIIEARVDNNSGQVSGVNSSDIGQVNINNADLSQLDSLSGIGEVRAQKIIDNRPYTSIEELVQKKIIPQSVFEEIKEKITVY